jgi:hypothetical protein
VLLVIGSLVSCNNGPERFTNSTSAPQLSRISLLKKDSTTKDGRRGNRYIIYGSHLKGTRSVSFNGFPAFVNAALITNKNLIVQVPDSTPVLKVNVPDSVWNKVVVTTNKGFASLPFHILVVPDIISFVPEIGAPGTIITITGKFFANLKKVKVGSTSVKVLSSSENTIKIKIPNNKSQGKITVITPGGKTVSKQTFAMAKYMIYDDGFVHPDWNANSYGNANIILDNTEHVQSGTHSIKITYTSGFAGLNIENDGNPIVFKDMGITKLRLSIYGGAETGNVWLDMNDNFDDGINLKVVKGKYQTFTIPISGLGNPTEFDDIEIYSQLGSAPLIVYIDNIGLF